MPHIFSLRTPVMISGSCRAATKYSVNPVCLSMYPPLVRGFYIIISSTCIHYSVSTLCSVICLFTFLTGMEIYPLRPSFLEVIPEPLLAGVIGGVCFLFVAIILSLVTACYMSHRRQRRRRKKRTGKTSDQKTQKLAINLS